MTFDDWFKRHFGIGPMSADERHVTINRIEELYQEIKKLKFKLEQDDIIAPMYRAAKYVHNHPIQRED